MIDLADPNFDPLALKAEWEEWNVTDHDRSG